VKTLGNVTWTVDRSQFDKKQRRFLDGVKNASKPLKRWAVATGTVIAKDWDKMKYGRLYSVTGFMARQEFREGVKWRPVRPMYGRITDGAVIPPWGGTKLLNGVGKVKGRKRPSGKRVKPGDVVGKDTGNMIKQFTRNPILHASKRAISLMTNVGYAVHQNNLRQFNKLVPGDKTRLIDELKLWMDSLATEWNKRRAA